MTASDARPGILLGYKFNPVLVSELGKRGELLGTMEQSHASAVPPGAGERTRILVTVGSYPADGALMDALPQLGLIACLGSGYDKVDIEAARRRGVRVTHSPGGNAACVADLTMGLLIASGRRSMRKACISIQR